MPCEIPAAKPPFISLLQQPAGDAAAPLAALGSLARREPALLWQHERALRPLCALLLQCGRHDALVAEVVTQALSHGGEASSQPIARYTESEACATLRRVLDIFCYLHNREGKDGLYVIYRDLKPENMVCDRSSRACLLT